MLPLWWLLGVAGFILPLMAVPLIASLLVRRRITAPKGIALYLTFLVWCAFSATQLSDPKQALSLVYHGGIYVAAGALFLYVLNRTRQELPTATVVRCLAVFFVITVVGGIVGMVIPAVTIPTPARAMMPAQLLNERFVSDLVRASTSSARAFGAYPIHRPQAPFTYTNQWGAAYAMTLPFAICGLAFVRRRLHRDLLLLVIVLSVFPLVFSLNRGAWLSVAAGLAYATLRSARGRNAQLLKIAALGSLVVGALLFLTPLGEIIMIRLTNGYGDAHRAELYAQSIELVRASPILGHGAPVMVSGNLSAGTHGQLWNILVSQGVPGLVLFVGWLGWAWWKASRPLAPTASGDRWVRLWCEVAIFVAVVQLPFYDLLPWGLPIAMVAAALAWREGDQLAGPARRAASAATAAAPSAANRGFAGAPRTAAPR
ncbi:MAG: O-antigen ligase family protein [Actinomycetota bacterium]